LFEKKRGIFMNAKLTALFAAGFAVQQLLELMTAILDLDSNPTFEKYKKAILGLLSLTAGLLLAGFVSDLRVLSALGVTASGLPFTATDVCVTGLVLSAGTEGINSILKFAKYSKEDKKTTAASNRPALGGAADANAASALVRLNRV
jgi:hypothetical protein